MDVQKTSKDVIRTKTVQRQSIYILQKTFSTYQDLGEHLLHGRYEQLGIHDDEDVRFVRDESYDGVLVLFESLYGILILPYYLHHHHHLSKFKLLTKLHFR